MNPDPSFATVLGWWVLDPLAIAVLGVVGLLYLRGLRDWKVRSRPVSRWQVASFYLGLTLMLVALVSPLDRLSDEFFIAHAIQHSIIRVLAPVLILLGAPLTPVLRGLPSDWRMGIVRPLISNQAARAVYRQLIHPIAIPGIYIAVLIFWQFPEPHDAAIRSVWVHYLMHFTMIASAMLFWWLIIDPRPHRSQVHYGVRVLIMGITLMPNSVTGAVLTFAQSPVYEAYGATRPWGMDVISDQRLGALIQWLGVDMMTAITAGVIFTMWYQRERRDDLAAERARRKESIFTSH